MATASRHLCRSIIRLSRHAPAKRKLNNFVQPSIRASPFQRHFSCLPQRFADRTPTDQTVEEDEELKTPSEDVAIDIDESEFQMPAEPVTTADLDPEERASYDQLPKADQKRYLAMQNHIKAIMESEQAEEDLAGMTDQVAREARRETENINFASVPPRLRNSFWAIDEEDEFAEVPDDGAEEEGYENITSIAESELEVHREIREYYRIAAWDLPLLGEYAKAFDEPTYKRPLKFRYTTYMGEFHPAAKKVVMEFKVEDMKQAAKLTDAQVRKLKLLVGPRYNPERETIKMSCEKFENPAQNKRYLGEMVEKLLKEAKNKADMFEDVPLDLRHHKWSYKPKFPESWLMKDSKDVQRLTQQRQETKLLEEAEQPVDGDRLVKMYVKARGALPVMAR